MPSWFARLEEAWKAAATSSQRGVSGSWWDVHCKSAFTLKLSMQTWQMWEINLVRAFWTEYLKMYFGLWYFDVFFFFSLFEDQSWQISDRSRSANLPPTHPPSKTTNKPVHCRYQFGLPGGLYFLQGWRRDGIPGFGVVLQSHCWADSSGVGASGGVQKWLFERFILGFEVRRIQSLILQYLHPWTTQLLIDLEQLLQVSCPWRGADPCPSLQLARIRPGDVCRDVGLIVVVKTSAAVSSTSDGFLLFLLHTFQHNFCCERMEWKGKIGDILVVSNLGNLQPSQNRPSGESCIRFPVARGPWRNGPEL